MERRKQILTLAGAIEATFSSSEWTEIGYLTATDKYINSHPRLLRSLHWGDADYRGHVLDTVARILETDEANLKRLLEYEPIANHLKTDDAATFEALRADAYGMAVAEVVPTRSQAAAAALADAQTLLEVRGPTSAVDRVHTGMHGFLKAACTDAAISFEADNTPNQLLKLLLDGHPSLQDLGPRSQEVRRMIRASAGIIDTMGTLRNRASLAHPNDELLGHEEALFVINLARSLIRFLNSKFRNAAA